MLDFKGKKVAAILSCNEIEKYVRWLPYACQAWELNGATPVVILINYKSIPDNIRNRGWDIRLLPEVKGVLTSYIAQIVRQFYAGLLTEYDTVITSDLDTICLPSKTFFERYINESISENRFIATRYNHDEIFIPWNIAPPLIWREVMNGISTEKEVVENIVNIFKHGGGYENVDIFKHPNTYYTIDQKILTRQIFEYTQSSTVDKGQINGYIFIDRDTQPLQMAHHRNYLIPFINNNKIKIIDKLDLYQCYITDDNKIIEQGTYQWNHGDKNIINFDQIDPEKHLTLGTGNATNFSFSILKKAFKTFWNYDKSITTSL